jgi:hypothetical protein
MQVRQNGNTRADSCATKPYVSPYTQESRKTATPKKQAARKNVTKKSPIDANELRRLEAQYLMKKKKLYSAKIEVLKKQVRISKSLLIFNIMLSLYEVHEMTTLWVVRVSIFHLHISFLEVSKLYL